MQSATVSTRPWRDGDLALLAASSDRLSAHTLQLRFHGGINTMPVRYLELIDHAWHTTWEGIVAVSGENLVGWAELSWTTDSPARAEVAVCVIDDEQGHGIGTRLLGEITTLARELGFSALHVDITADNAAARRAWRHVVGTAAATIRVGDAVTA